MTNSRLHKAVKIDSRELADILSAVNPELAAIPYEDIQDEYIVLNYPMPGWVAIVPALEVLMVDFTVLARDPIHVTTVSLIS